MGSEEEERPPYWRVSPFIGFLADPFIDRSALTGGHIANTFVLEYAALGGIYNKIINSRKEQSESSSSSTFQDELSLWSTQDLDLLKYLCSQLEITGKLSIEAAKCESPEDLMKIITPLSENLSKLKDGEICILPGGWTGLAKSAFVLFIVEKKGDLFSLVVCNAGEGMEYHPSRIFSQPEDVKESYPSNMQPGSFTDIMKIKYRTCIRLDGISPERILDNGFWTLMFCLWVRQSEYNRVEVLYDVFLPWLVVRNDLKPMGENTEVSPQDRMLFAEAIMANEDDPNASWRTPQRSETSAFRCVHEGLRYILRSRGLSDPQLKQLSFVMRKAYMTSAMEELFAVSLKIVNAKENSVATWTSSLKESILFGIESTGIKPKEEKGDSEVGEKGPQKPAVEPPKNISEVFEKIGSHLVRKSGSSASVGDFANKVVGIYFSAHWCPPCRSFTPRLAAAFEKRKAMCSQINVPCDFEIIFVSNDHSAEKFREYFAEMPWDYAVKYDQEDVRKQVGDMFGLRGIPTLVLFNRDGTFICDTGTQCVLRDPSLKRFPWNERKEKKDSSASGAEEKAPKLPKFELIDKQILRLGCKSLATTAVKESKAGRVSMQCVEEVLCMVTTVEKVLNRIPPIEDVFFEEESKHSTSKLGPLPFNGHGLPPLLAPEVVAKLDDFSGGDFLALKDVENYAGDTTPSSSPPFSNFLEVPSKRVDKFSHTIAALIKCDNICDELLERARDGSTTSRLALQMQIIALISDLFTIVLPMPLPLGKLSGANKCIWREGLTNTAEFATLMSTIFGGKGGVARMRDVQKVCLQRIHKLMMTFATVWQAIESPVRSYDSERSLVAGCMFAIFDCCIRTVCADAEPLFISEMLQDDGGYAFSLGVCQDNREYFEVSHTMELVRPELTLARDGMLDYLSSVKRSCSNTIFFLRQPSDGKMEFKKYSTTVTFLRRLIERCGYELMARGGMGQASEMESLMNWMLSERTSLAQDHPEFLMLRDMICMFKFLATMETRQVELLRRRVAPQPGRYWRLTFDEGGAQRGGRMFNSRMFGRRMQGAVNGLAWEIANVRGADLSIADVQVMAFGDREIAFGEGPVVHSPSDPGNLLHSPGMPISEDDILHCDKLPTFGDTLSRSESELLVSFLTVNYMRIPLVLGFFANTDRVTYLFDPNLQALLRSVLFEPGPWVSEDERLKEVEAVPIRQTAEQKSRKMARSLLGNDYKGFQDNTLDPVVSYLGTPSGLLLNEMYFAPDATLSPLMKLLSAVDDLRGASVYSTDATFICFMILLAVDVESYVSYAIDELILSGTSSTSTLTGIFGRGSSATCRAYLPNLLKFKKELKKYFVGISEILQRWCAEAEKRTDMPTAVVVRAYIALLHTSSGNGADHEFSEREVVELLGSIAYVRNWHGFGLGQLRSQIISERAGGQGSMSNEERLLRFLQAQGIDTKRMAKSSLDMYLSSSNRHRPIFLHVGGQTIRAPTLFRTEESTDGEVFAFLPPADVPEERLFQLLQKHRRDLVEWLSSCAENTLERTLDSIVRIATRNRSFQSGGWSRDADLGGPGRYLAEKANLRLDVQTGEIIWRNDALKPVPDSMTQFGDFETLFGRRALHCGLVKKQSRRNWVHVIGTNYDLIEWDEPDVDDQGAGAPQDPVAGGDSSAFPVCLMCGKEGQCWICSTCTSINCGYGPSDAHSKCTVCGTQKGGEEKKKKKRQRNDAPPVLGPGGLFGQRQQQPEEQNDEPLIEFADEFRYRDILYKRHLDPYDKEPEIAKSEQWVYDLLLPLLLSLYPEMPPENKMNWKLLFPEEVLAEDSNICLLVGCDGVKEEDATWKEVWCIRDLNLVLVYTLISHGRKIYRHLVFTSNVKLALHGLAPTTSGVVSEAIKTSAGEFKRKRVSCPSLEVTRRNDHLGGIETYFPPRLLQGTIPSALLESFHFWQGEDGIIRGEPIDESSQWFSYKVEVSVGQNSKSSADMNPLSSIRILRRPVHREFTPISSRDIGPSGLVRSMKEDKGLSNAEAFVNEASVQMLMALGFPISACRMALRKNHNDVEMASHWLTDDSNRADILACEMDFDTNMLAFGGDDVGFGDYGTPQRNSPKASGGLLSATPSYAWLQVLEEEGFGASSSKHALDVCEGDVEMARSWLIDPQNAVEIAMLESAADAVPPSRRAKQKEAQPSDSKAASELKSSATETVVRPVVDLVANAADDLYLLNLLSLRSKANASSLKSFAHRALDLLTRIEDLSHILIWMKSGKNEVSSGDALDVVSIELPRLKLRFQPRVDKDDVVRLYLHDHAGWYVSDRYAINTVSGERKDPLCAGSKFLSMQLESIKNCIIIENHAQEVSVLVANHDVYRPQVQGSAFSTELIFERGSVGWQQVMETHFYLYSVHASHTFLIPPTVASALYLVLLKMLNREYSEAFGMIDGSIGSIDTLFSPEEQWIFDQFSRTNDDGHPDAHACRLKLTLAVMYSENRCGWETHVEMDSYLAKLPHVSADCRLSAEDELNLVRRCSTGTGRIKNRLEYMKQTCPNTAVISRAEETSGTFVEVNFKGIVPKWGGQPWMKLCKASQEYLDSYGSQLTRLHYKRPDSKIEGGSVPGSQGGSQPPSRPSQPGEIDSNTLSMAIAAAMGGTGSVPSTDYSSSPVNLFNTPAGGGGGGAGAGAGRPANLSPILKDKDAIGLIWGDDLLMDELSGSNRQLGFLFFYDLLCGNFSFNIGGKNCTRSLGELLLRWYHLKQMRWGRDTVEDTEQESRQSRELAYLVSIIYGQLFLLPKVPDDSNSYNLLQRGVNIYSGNERQKEQTLLLRSFLTTVEERFKQYAQSARRKVVIDHTHYVASRMQSHPLFSGVESVVRCEKFFDFGAIQSLRPKISNSNRDVAVLKECKWIGGKDTSFFATRPLDTVTLENYVGNEPAVKPENGDTAKWGKLGRRAEEALPFDLWDHPLASVPVARRLLQRLEKDVQGFAAEYNTLEVPKVLGLLSADLDKLQVGKADIQQYESVVTILEKLVASLDAIIASDSIFVESLIVDIRKDANSISLSGDDVKTRTHFILRRFAGQQSRISFNYLTADILSSNFHDDVLSINPHLPRELLDDLFDMVASVLFYASRVQQANRARAQANGLKAQLKRLLKPSYTANRDDFQNIRQSSSALAETITSERHYVRKAEGGKFTYDPRYLVVEYVFSILLRKRQVEMVESFVHSMRAGDSRVQQMIMGQGKTTVVGPLLVLILADGESLVTQVMPTALLEQSRNVLRNRFSSTITKKVRKHLHMPLNGNKL